MLDPPPPPPRHPSTRSNRPPTPPRPHLSSLRSPPAGSPSLEADSLRAEHATAAPSGPATPVVEVDGTSTPDASSAVDDSEEGLVSAAAASFAGTTAPIAPPRHPKTAGFSSPLPSPRLSPPPSPPPLRGGGSRAAAQSAVERKLRDLEDQETLDLLERVGDQLTDVRLAGDSREDVVYPERDQFRSDDGRLDVLGYALAYLATAALDYTPPGLVAPPPPASFSFRALRTDLERLYVLCPPTVWQRFLFGTLSSLWRWENPRRTALWASAYLVLWAWDLLPVLPFAFLLLHLVKAHVFPPSTEELLQRAADRRSRTRDAAELGKQLGATNRFGLLAGEGVRGLWSEVRDRFSREEDGSPGGEKTLAAALGSGAALGAGVAGGAGTESLRRRAGSTATPSGADADAEAGSATPSTPPAGAAPPSALARGLGSSASVLGAPAAPLQTQLSELQPAPDARPNFQAEDPAYDPARGGPGGDGELSLYRLVRHLAALLGPQVVLWCAEAADVLEMVKNVLAHPDHPASRKVALRFALVCAALIATPAWLLYKSAWLYLGIEVFVLWRVRELYPDWRRATISYWWLLVGAPTDVEYALYLLRQRSLTQRPLQGAKTLRRAARAPSSGSTTATANGTVLSQSATRAVARRAGRALLRRANGGAGEEVLLASGESEAVLSSFFAMHASAPGFLRLSRSTVLFTPSRRLKRLGKLASRFTGGSTESASDDPDLDPDDAASLASGGTASTAAARAQGEVQIGVNEIASVRKETRLRAFEGLVVTTKEGKVWRFANVARRDDAFNKLLSLSSARWEQT